MKSNPNNPENWNHNKNILVIMAHPDDPEFFCGATIARWRSIDHQVSYCLLTKGQRGTQDPEADPLAIGGIRMEEQLNAAGVLGVSNIRFMDYMDGELVPDLQLRNELVRTIREIKPDIIVTSDPTNLFPGENRINHPDHRAAGQAVIDAIFPAAGNPGFKVEKDNVQIPAHHVEEIWLSLTTQPNFDLDVTAYLEAKIEALLCHQSQVRLSREELRTKLMGRTEMDAGPGERAYVEKFRRIILQ